MTDEPNSEHLALLDRYNKSVEKIYQDLTKFDKPYREKLSKEEVIELLEQIFKNLEEGKVPCAPLKRHFKME
jgi:hypothetical protein